MICKIERFHISSGFCEGNQLDGFSIIN